MELRKCFDWCWYFSIYVLSATGSALQAATTHVEAEGSAIQTPAVDNLLLQETLRKTLFPKTNQSGAMRPTDRRYGTKRRRSNAALRDRGQHLLVRFTTGTTHCFVKCLSSRAAR